MLTKRQKEILDFIKKYIKDSGYSPSLKEIGKKFKLSSIATVHQHIENLKEKGYLKKIGNHPRSIEIQKEKQSSGLVRIPFLGIIAAGQPIEAIEEKEKIEIPKNLISKSGENFALKVQGNSMVDEGIFNGDIVIIKKQQTAENGETVVALLNDNEVTLKKIYKEKSGFRLQPANPSLKPIFVKELQVQGKVVSIIRNFEENNNKIPHSIKDNPYFSKDDFVLYKEDCLKILSQLPENSIDMIFADPPYFLSSGSFTCSNGRMTSVKKGNWDLSNGLKKDFEFQLEWIKSCRRVLRPGGTIWISGTYHSIYQCGFALQMNKFHILNDISWFKPNASPNLSCRFFTASHETLIWARKEKKAKHKFNYELMKNGNWPDDFIKKPNLQMRSVWSIYPPKRKEKKFGKHPTQKPLDLLNRIVLASTNKGDVVLDPFTGSSTTGLACIINNRKFIGIDTERRYLDLSIKRFKELNSKLI